MPHPDFPRTLEGIGKAVADLRLTQEAMGIEYVAAMGALERRVETLEDGQRPSLVDLESEQRMSRLLEQQRGRIVDEVVAAIDRRKSDNPDSTVKYKTKDGNKLSAPAWAALIALVLVLLIAAVWRAHDIAEVLMLSK